MHIVNHLAPHIAGYSLSPASLQPICELEAILGGVGEWVTLGLHTQVEMIMRKEGEGMDKEASKL